MKSRNVTWESRLRRREPENCVGEQVRGSGPESARSRAPVQCTLRGDPLAFDFCDSFSQIADDFSVELARPAQLVGDSQVGERLFDLDESLLIFLVRT